MFIKYNIDLIIKCYSARSRDISNRIQIKYSCARFLCRNISKSFCYAKKDIARVLLSGLEKNKMLLKNINMLRFVISLSVFKFNTDNVIAKSTRTRISDKYGFYYYFT